MNAETVCTRASTLAKALDTSNDGLADYHTATALQTLIANADLLDRARLIDPAGSWRDYKPVLAAAKERRGSPEAGSGTNIHRAVELLIKGRDPGSIPDHLRKPARMVLDQVAAIGAEVVHSERFVAAIGVLRLPDLKSCSC